MSPAALDVSSIRQAQLSVVDTGLRPGADCSAARASTPHACRHSLSKEGTVKDFHCKDMGGSSCNFIARGNNDDDVIKQAKSHAQSAHHMQLNADQEKQARTLIHEEGSDAHKKSMAKA
jgi:predicted small metal-binding protein